MRVKVLQVLYAYYEDRERTLESAVNELSFSMDKSYDLFISLLQLGVELTNFHRKCIESASRKYFPTEEEKNPNMKWVNNRLIKMLSESMFLSKEVEKRKISFTDDKILLELLNKEVLESEIYKSYLTQQWNDFKSDQDFVVRIYSNVLLSSDTLLDALEEKSIYWNDDLGIVGSFLIKTLKKVREEDEKINFPPKFSDEEGEKFAKELFLKTFSNKENYENIISDASQNWEVDRLAFMDKLILQMALAEIMNFPTIPLPVTMNEYIEIAKSYSTAKSGMFVNGMLDKIVSNLKDKELIVK